MKPLSMHVLSVNIGQEQTIQRARSSGKTGIYKQPVAAAVTISPLGLAGDTICDTQHHGGVDQAVYIYGQADYDWWAQELGAPLAPGTFGENLILSGLESAPVAIGDRFHLGSAILEVTSPRHPCDTLTARMGDKEFSKRFQAAGRPGLYCRVIQTGSVQVGDTVTYQPYSGETVTILEMFRDSYQPTLTVASLRRFLAAPIADKKRLKKEQQLKDLQSTLE